MKIIDGEIQINENGYEIYIPSSDLENMQYKPYFSWSYLWRWVNASGEWWR